MSGLVIDYAKAYADLSALQMQLRQMEDRKDAAYLERNRCVALIARMALASGWGAGTARTAIEGWSEDWHGCVYIDLPTGQCSWHFHDSQAHLFADLPPYPAPWDGHDTPEQHWEGWAARRIVDALEAARVAPVLVRDAAEVLGVSVPEVCAALATAGGSPRSTNMEISGEELLAVAAALMPARVALTDAARDVLAERQRQISVEGWTPEHDDKHGDASMSTAAACYALADIRSALRVQTVDVNGLWSWTGWSLSWFKPKGRRHNLVRAAALLLAEVERLDRAAGIPGTDGGADHG